MGDQKPENGDRNPEEGTWNSENGSRIPKKAPGTVEEPGTLVEEALTASCRM